MSFKLSYTNSNTVPEVRLPSSKSISNRLLIAQALSDSKVQLANLSEAQDTQVLQKSLISIAKVIDVGMAGTAFRFLTAFYSIKEGERVLTGAGRMKERPIQILVEKLSCLGAKIDYVEQDGFPPLQIQGANLKGGQLSIDASVSSQYISALLLIAPYLKVGLELNLVGDVVSSPYIDLTISLQHQLGIQVARNENSIRIEAGTYRSNREIIVESDWSSAAFFYQLVAFSGRSIFIQNLNSNSLQGDVECWKIFTELGVVTEFKDGGAFLHFDPKSIKRELYFDLTDTPDLIPSIAVTASQLVDKITIIGTKTLYIKECNRVEALKMELLKIGAVLREIGGNSFEIVGQKITQTENTISFSTYNDHRIAMCFAPFAVVANIEMDNKNVVAKSFPNFWDELKKFGITD